MAKCVHLPYEVVEAYAQILSCWHSHKDFKLESEENGKKKKLNVNTDSINGSSIS